MAARKGTAKGPNSKGKAHDKAPMSCGKDHETKAAMQCWHINITVSKAGKPISMIKENQEISVRLENKGERIEEASLWLANERKYEFPVLDKGIIEVIINVGQHVGDTLIVIRDEKGQFLCNPIELCIEPKGLSMEHFKYIRGRRLPELVDELGAENVLPYPAPGPYHIRHRHRGLCCGGAAQVQP